MPDDQLNPAEQTVATPAPAQAPSDSDASEPLPHEEPAPMLDVHPAHHAATTWREFFIHIATIVLGLLIAVSLEQTVEYIHHRGELAEARRELATERKINVVRFSVETEEFHRFTPILQNNLAIFVYLRQHPGKPLPPSLGALRWNGMTVVMLDNAWTAAQHGAMEYMPQSESRTDAQLYARLDILTQAIKDARAAYVECMRFQVIDPDPAHLTPPQLDAEIDLISKALLASRSMANRMRNIHAQFPDFAPAPSDADYVAIIHGTLTPSAQDNRDREAATREISRFTDYERSLDQNEGTE
jgi:hypothetical protein